MFGFSILDTREQWGLWQTKSLSRGDSINSAPDNFHKAEFGYSIMGFYDFSRKLRTICIYVKFSDLRILAQFEIKSTWKLKLFVGQKICGYFCSL